MKTKHIFYLFLLNVMGLLLSILYGVFGGSGGETTEGVFMVISLTGLVTILGAVALALNFKLFKSKWYWLLLLIFAGILESILYNWF
jgi:hypothetical protein